MNDSNQSPITNSYSDSDVSWDNNDYYEDTMEDDQMNDTLEVGFNLSGSPNMEKMSTSHKTPTEFPKLLNLSDIKPSGKDYVSQLENELKMNMNDSNSTIVSNEQKLFFNSTIMKIDNNSIKSQADNSSQTISSKSEFSNLLDVAFAKTPETSNVSENYKSSNLLLLLDLESTKGQNIKETRNDSDLVMDYFDSKEQTEKQRQENENSIKSNHNEKIAVETLPAPLIDVSDISSSSCTNEVIVSGPKVIPILDNLLDISLSSLVQNTNENSSKIEEKEVCNNNTKSIKIEVEQEKELKQTNDDDHHEKNYKSTNLLDLSFGQIETVIAAEEAEVYNQNKIESENILMKNSLNEVDEHKIDNISIINDISDSNSFTSIKTIEDDNPNNNDCPKCFEKDPIIDKNNITATDVSTTTSITDAETSLIDLNNAYYDFSLGLSSSGASINNDFESIDQHHYKNNNALEKLEQHQKSNIIEQPEEKPIHSNEKTIKNISSNINNNDNNDNEQQKNTDEIESANIIDINNDQNHAPLNKIDEIENTNTLNKVKDEENNSSLNQNKNLETCTDKGQENIKEKISNSIQKSDRVILSSSKTKNSLEKVSRLRPPSDLKQPIANRFGFKKVLTATKTTSSSPTTLKSKQTTTSTKKSNLPLLSSIGGGNTISNKNNIPIGANINNVNSNISNSVGGESKIAKLNNGSRLPVFKRNI